MPFKWLMDRLFLMGMSSAIVLTDRSESHRVSSVWAALSLAFALIAIPSCVRTAHAHWFRAVERDAYNAKREHKSEQKIDLLLNVWPFKNSGVRNKFKTMVERRRDDRYKGIFGYYRVYLSNPMHRFKHSRFIRSFTSRIIWQALNGPVFQESMKAGALTSITLANPYVEIIYPTKAAYLSTICIFSYAVSVGWPTWIDWYRLIREHCREIYFKLVRLMWYSHDVFCDRYNRKARLKHVIKQSKRVFNRSKKANWAFPGYSRQWVREFEVDEVYMVSNELGTHHPGRITVPYRAERCRALMNSQEKRRYNLQKVLVKVGPTGYFRDVIDRQMPIQIPFKQYYHGEKFPVQRLAATFHIVNHGGHRYPKRHSHWDDDDSYLSFYTDPRFVPAMGDLRNSHKGHGYLVKYDSNNKRGLIIRGPGIKAGITYNVRSCHNRPPIDEDHESDTEVDDHSLLSSLHSTTNTASAHEHCFKNGRIRVKVPRGKAPDTSGTFKIKPPYGGHTFKVDGGRINVVWDTHHRAMYICHRNLVSVAEKYEVIWPVRRRRQKFDVSADAAVNEFLFVPLPDDLVPDLTSFISLRGENGHCIDVDPRDTDAHQFTIPDYPLVTGGKGFARLAGAPADTWNKIVGQSIQDPVNDCAIPCTVVQVVDPINGEVRVHPNFIKAVKILRAKKEELIAQKTGLMNPEYAPLAALEVMSSSEYVDYWKREGLDITTNNRWVEPASMGENHTIFRGKYDQVRRIQASLQKVLTSRFDVNIEQIDRNIVHLAQWFKAYANTEMTDLQSKKDCADWSLTPVKDLRTICKDLKTLKREYERQLPNFQYPMVVYERLVSRRPKLEAQYDAWQSQISNWLFKHEGAYTRTFSGGHSCLKQTVYEFIHCLKRNFERQERLTAHKFNSPLHFVTPSRNVRGMHPVWRPDPLVAQGACVRVWPADDTKYGADFTKEPLWLNCLIKLTGVSVDIYLPGPDDANRPFHHPDEWKHLHGFSIPLQCFQQLEISKDDSDPVYTDPRSSHVIGLRTKIVWRKQLSVDVDDYYIRRIEDDAFSNTISFPGQHGKEDKYRIMLGNPIKNRQQEAKIPKDERTVGLRGKSAYPLTFRVNDLYYPRWRDVCLGAHMYDNHANLSGFNGRVDDDSVSSSSSSSPPPPPPKMVSRELTISSTTILPSSSIIPSPSSTSIVILESSDPPPVIKSRSVSELESYVSVSSTVLSSIKPPSPMGQYKGQWKNWRYHGFGKLMDHEGHTVYEGEWRDGLRWGQGKCHFYDSLGCKWEYEGEFVQDEFCGRGTMRLVDELELERLRKSDNIDDVYRLTKFVGYFKLPHGFRRRGSFTEIDHKIHKAVMKKFFIDNETFYKKENEFIVDKNRHDFHRDLVGSDSGSSDTDDLELPVYSNTDKSKTLLVDMTMWRNSANIFNIGDLAPKDIDRMAMRRNRGIEDPVDLILRSGDPTKSPRIMATVESMLPHRTRWMRELNPMYGYANIAERLARGHVIFADGSQYEGHLMDGVPHGNGFYQGITGVQYEGNFLAGFPHGYGIMENGRHRPLKRVKYPRIRPQDFENDVLPQIDSVSDGDSEENDEMRDNERNVPSAYELHLEKCVRRRVQEATVFLVQLPQTERDALFALIKERLGISLKGNTEEILYQVIKDRMKMIWKEKRRHLEYERKRSKLANKGQKYWQHVGEFHLGRKQGRGASVSISDAGGHYFCGNFVNDRLGGGSAYCSIDQRLFGMEQARSRQILMTNETVVTYDPKYPYKNFVGMINLDGNPAGFGKITWHNGTYYRGLFNSGLRSGMGVQYDAFGKKVIECMWKQDVPDGPCEAYRQSNDVYFTGHFVTGERSGVGTLCWPNGLILYEGMFVADRIQGRGTHYLESDLQDRHLARYDGMFRTEPISSDCLSIEDDPEKKKKKKKKKDEPPKLPDIFSPDWKAMKVGHGRMTWFHQLKNKHVKKRPTDVERIIPVYYEGGWKRDVPFGNGKYADIDGSANVYEWNGTKPAKKADLKMYNKSEIQKKLMIPSSNALVYEKSRYWGREGMNMNPILFQALHRSGEGMWESRIGKKFKFVPSDKVPTLEPAKSRPKKMIPNRVVKELEENSKLMERISRTVKSFTPGMDQAKITFRSGDTKSELVLGNTLKVVFNNLIATPEDEETRKKLIEAIKLQNGIYTKKAEKKIQHEYNPLLIMRMGANPARKIGPLRDTDITSSTAIILNSQVLMDYNRESQMTLELHNYSQLGGTKLLATATLQFDIELLKKEGGSLEPYKVGLLSPTTARQIGRVEVHLSLVKDRL